LDEPAVASHQGFQESKKEGPEHFMVKFCSGLSYMVWILL